MGIGTFGSFTQARLGIYAAQSGLSVTGTILQILIQQATPDRSWTKAASMRRRQ